MCALLIGALFVSLPARADLVSYFLDQTNVDPILPDGVPYLRVDIADEGDDIRFTVTLLPPLLAIAGTNFGIQLFGFNATSDLGVTPDDITELPTGWDAGANSVLDGFGEFDLDVDGLGSNRQSPFLTFLITGIADDLPSDYAGSSSGTAEQGNHFFAAHVAGFELPGSTVESAFFGGSTVVPLPAAFWLFVSALGGLGLWRRRLAAPRSALPVT